MLDANHGQSISFPSSYKCCFRLEVPVWSDADTCTPHRKWPKMPQGSLPWLGLSRRWPRKEPKTDEAVRMEKLTWCRLGTGASHFDEGSSTVPRVPTRSAVITDGNDAARLQNNGSWDPVTCPHSAPVCELLFVLHSMFGLLATGDSLRHCPQAAAQQPGQNGHVLSLALGWTMALLTGRSTIAVAGVFGAGKTSPSSSLPLLWKMRANSILRALWDAKKQRPIQPELPANLLLTIVSMSSQELK